MCATQQARRGNLGSATTVYSRICEETVLQCLSLSRSSRQGIHGCVDVTTTHSVPNYSVAGTIVLAAVT